MKLEAPDIVLEKSADFEVKKFGIGNEAVILKILRSKLYPVPQKTIVQEY
jgi:hypothetical protein